MIVKGEIMHREYEYSEQSEREIEKRRDRDRNQARKVKSIFFMNEAEKDVKNQRHENKFPARRYR